MNLAYSKLMPYRKMGLPKNHLKGRCSSYGRTTVKFIFANKNPFYHFAMKPETLKKIQQHLIELEKKMVCKAAHVPVVWATQVLETLNKSGMATR
jgi:hypothetical protein